MIFFGIIITIIAIYFGTPGINEYFFDYLHKESFFLVVGGTMGASVISSSWDDTRRLFATTRAYLLPRWLSNKRRITPEQMVNKLVEIADLAQRKNRQDLHAEGRGFGDGFLENALTLLSSGLDRNFIENTLETDISESSKKNGAVVRQVRTMGTYAPMFGMIGTVMGIVQVLRNVSDVDNIVSGMSLALITTLYGLFLTSIIFIPVSNRIRDLSYEDQQIKEIITVGILAIYDKEIPLKVKRTLMAYLDSQQKKHVK